MSHPKVYIIILNWNGLKDTLECLESVFKLDYPNFEVIVVDNGSINNSVEVIRKIYPQVILIENKENLGYTGGSNIGMRYAMKNNADYMWLLNNDTIIEQYTLSKLVNAAEISPDIGLVSPIIYYYDEPEKLQFCGSYIDWKNFVIPQAKNLKSLDELDTKQMILLWGTALLIKGNVIKKIGYLNSKYFAYHEDCEYSVRSAKSGYRNVLEPKANIYHKDSRSTGNPGSPMQVFFMVRNIYFLWMSNLKGLDKFNYFKKYLAGIISHGASLRREKQYKCVDACFDGAWAAIRDIGGPWDRNTKMPGWLRKIFYFLASWHPYFWANLVSGDFSHIFSETIRRMRLRLINSNPNR